MPKVIDENELFKAVIGMLVSRGYEGGTTKEIAEMAGVNEATIFRKYGSKAKLFEKAIRHQLSDTPLHRLVYTGDLEADLCAIVKAYLETNRLHGEIIPAIFAEIPRRPALKGAVTILWENIQVAVEIIQTYQLAGDLKAEGPIAGLNSLLGPLMTSQMFRRVELGSAMPDMNPQEHVNYYLQGRKK